MIVSLTPEELAQLRELIDLLEKSREGGYMVENNERRILALGAMIHEWLR
jgi:hypothetical protein